MIVFFFVQQPDWHVLGITIFYHYIYYIISTSYKCTHI